jgi:hypothetical protein
MKKIEGRIISTDELTMLLTTDDSESITYDDIEKMFSDKDLKETASRLGED